MKRIVLFAFALLGVGLLAADAHAFGRCRGGCGSGHVGVFHRHQAATAASYSCSPGCPCTAAVGCTHAQAAYLNPQPAGLTYNYQFPPAQFGTCAGGSCSGGACGVPRRR